MSRWVTDFEHDNGFRGEDLDGVSWVDAPVPRRWHRCKPQSRAFNYPGMSVDYVERCACGAIRFESDDIWINRNERRR